MVRRRFRKRGKRNNKHGSRLENSITRMTDRREDSGALLGSGVTENGQCVEVKEPQGSASKNARKRRVLLALVGTLASLSLCIVFTSVFSVPEEQHLDRRKRDEDHSSRTRTLDSPIKVLVVTEDADSARLVGDVFDQDPTAFYLYEPLWGLYRYLGVGADYLTLPWNTSVYDNGTLREYPASEQKAMSDVIKALYSCNASDIPLEILLNKYIFSSEDATRHKSLSDFKYIRCVEDEFEDTGVLRVLDSCKENVSKWCPVIKHGGHEQNCYKFIHLYRDNRQVGKDIINRIFEKPAGYLADFMDHQLCMNEMSKSRETCASPYTQACMTADVIALVTMRLDLDVIPEVLSEVPGTKVVYVSRDPRDTVTAARREILWDSNFSINKEAVRVCAKMRKDLGIIQQHPSTILQLRYEDLVQYPQSSMLNLRTFLGLESSDNGGVLEWMSGLFKAGDTDYSRTIQLHGDEENIDIWKDVITSTDNDLIKVFCSDVLDTLNY